MASTSRGRRPHGVDLLGQVQQVAAVAAGHVQQRPARILGQGQRAADMRLGAGEQDREGRVVQGLQHEDLRSGEDGAVQLEGGVLRRRADQDDGAVLHDRQEGVLLGAVEAMDLVHEEQGALPHGAAVARGVEHPPQVGDAALDGGERLEMQIRRGRAGGRWSSCRCPAAPRG
jgi:hypothetical protein